MRLPRHTPLQVGGELRAVAQRQVRPLERQIVVSMDGLYPKRNMRVFTSGSFLPAPRYTNAPLARVARPLFGSCVKPEVAPLPDDILCLRCVLCVTNT